MNAAMWWHRPRQVSVVVDNTSWIIPYAEALVKQLNETGDRAVLCRDHVEVEDGVAAFLLGCVRLVPPEVLARNRYNLVVHESDLPKGRGFAPLAWQILEGKNEIPICLLEASDEVDAGVVYYRDVMRFEGHELHNVLRARQGKMTIELCLRFMNEANPPVGRAQQGQPSYYGRRRPKDSRVDLERPLGEQFELLRIVDNEHYPAYFDYRGHRYRLAIFDEGERPPAWSGFVERNDNEER